ncbi:MAG: redoxin domain-containing protein [Bacteroidota bacterium]
MQTKAENHLLDMQPITVYVYLLLCILAFTAVACSTAESANNSNTVQSRSIEEAHEIVPENQYNLGEKAPEFALTDLNGSTKQLSDYEGKFLLIHFATTWCPFCNAEAPTLEKIAQQYKDQDVEVLIIDVKEDQSLVQEKLQDRFNFSFPILLDPEGKVAASYAPEGVLPDLTRDEVVLASNLLIDPQGKIQFYSLLDSKDFDAELVALQARLHELL